MTGDARKRDLFSLFSLLVGADALNSNLCKCAEHFESVELGGHRGILG